METKHLWEDDVINTMKSRNREEAGTKNRGEAAEFSGTRNEKARTGKKRGLANQRKAKSLKYMNSLSQLMHISDVDIMANNIDRERE